MRTKIKQTVHQKLPILMLALGLPLSSESAPAPWYWWQSLTTGKQICRQNSPGEGWQQMPQAYQDARCKRPVKQQTAD